MHFSMLVLFFAAVVFATAATEQAAQVGDASTKRARMADLHQDDPFDLDDQMSLLQAEAKTKVRASVPIEMPRMIKQDMCDGSCQGASAWFGGVEELPPAVDEATDPAAVGVAKGEAGEDISCRLSLACIVEAFIVIVALGGFRLYNRANNVECSKLPQAKEMSEDAWQSLMQAAVMGDSKRCMQLLAECRPPHSREDAWGCTLLHAAAKGGAADVVTCLLERGSRVHDRDAWDETPLHFAARAGNVDVCEVLLAYGAQTDAVNADDRTPLVTAAEAGQEAVCKLLLARGASAGDLDDSELPPLLSTLLMLSLIGQCSDAADAAKNQDFTPVHSGEEYQDEDWQY